MLNIFFKKFKVFYYSIYLILCKKTKTFINSFFFEYRAIENILCKSWVGLFLQYSSGVNHFFKIQIKYLKNFILKNTNFLFFRANIFKIRNNPKPFDLLDGVYYNTSGMAYLNKVVLNLALLNTEVNSNWILETLVKKTKILKNSVVKGMLSVKPNMIPTQSFKVRIKFSKRNVFFTLSTVDEKVLKKTTMKQEGYMGRMSKKYHSIMMVTRTLKSTLRFLRIVSFDLIILGWSRYRHAIKKAFRDNWAWLKKNKYKTFKKDFTYYDLKIPHNGCRANKKKNKKRIKWKRFFSKPRIQLKKANYFFGMWRGFIKNPVNRIDVQKFESLKIVSGVSKKIMIKPNLKNNRILNQLQFLINTNGIKLNISYSRNRYKTYKEKTLT